MMRMSRKRQSRCPGPILRSVREILAKTRRMGPGLTLRVPRDMRALALAFFTIAALALPATAQTFPELTGRVVDNADTLDIQTEAEIEQKLAALEQKTSNQLVVVTVPSLEGREIEDYGYRLGRYWGIGQKDHDNGALLIVAPNERKVRVEVGYGLEGTLTDAISALIIHNAILPRFRAGDMTGGISRGSTISSRFSKATRNMPRPSQRRSAPRPTKAISCSRSSCGCSSPSGSGV